MADSKPYASLSSGLLARKGGAKPAMRPQGFNGFANGLGGGTGGSLEDLGWNDMGPEDEYHTHSGPIGLTPARGHGLTPESAHDQQRDVVPFQAPQHEEPSFQAAQHEEEFEEPEFDEGETDEAPFAEAPVHE